MEKIVMSDDEILELAHRNGAPIDMVYNALNQPLEIEKFMRPPYRLTKEGAIMSVVAQDYYADGTHMD